MKVERRKLEIFLNKLLNIYQYKDYGPNGLQVEGETEIGKIAFAVSATKDSITKAVELGANALIVHHGLFWKFHGTRTITGPFAKRVKPLIQNNINLFGYHLPLDAHLEVGNAACLGEKLGLEEIAEFGDHKGMPTGIKGKFTSSIKASELSNKLERILSHKILMSSPSENRIIHSIGIITGGANGDWVGCVQNNLDAYLTGEMSEHDWHEAKESNITMFAGGHNATEQFGVQRLMEKVKDEFGIDAVFISSDNPA